MCFLHWSIQDMCESVYVVCMCVCVVVCAYVRACACVCVRVCMCVYICTCVHACMQISLTLCSACRKPWLRWKKFFTLILCMYCIAICLFAFTFTVPSPILLCLTDNEGVSTFIALVHVYIPACIYTVPKSCLIKFFNCIPSWCAMLIHVE